MPFIDPAAQIRYAIAEQIPAGDLAKVVELQTKRLRAEMIGVTPDQWDRHQSIVEQMAIASPFTSNSAAMIAGSELIYHNAAAGKPVLPSSPAESTKWSGHLWSLIAGEYIHNSLPQSAVACPTIFAEWVNQAVELWRIA